MTRSAWSHIGLGACEDPIGVKSAPDCGKLAVSAYGIEAMNHTDTRARQIIWKQPDGKPVSCEEKLKVLNENLDEIRQFCQDAFEDALLMGCDESDVREVFENVVRSIDNPYRKD